MRVRYLGTRGSGPKPNTAVTIGRDYVVLAMSVRKAQVMLMVVAEDTGMPAWLPSSEFDLVADEIPSTWRIRLGASASPNEIHIAPQPWLETGFYEDLWGDGDTRAIIAQEVFAREMEVILSES
jgi:hypothetical protein